MVTVVTGFSRCGTSLMMQMLQAGGYPTFSDHTVSYETDHALELPENTTWLKQCEGKAVKILEPQSHTPPAGLDYRFLWMRRNAREQAKSQLKFMRLVGGFDMPSSRSQVLAMAAGIKRDTPAALALLRGLGRTMVVEFEELLARPGPVSAAVARYLGANMDLARMVATVRRRPPECLPGLLELQLVAEEQSAV